MRKIGIIGGLSWYSSQDYYRYINEIYQSYTSNDNSAPLILNSLNMETVAALFKEKNKAQNYLIKEAMVLENAGCDILLIASNTVHAAFAAIENKTNMQCIHIADSCAKRLKSQGLKKVGLLATRYTLEKDFLKKRLASHGLEVFIPDQEQTLKMQEFIQSELTVGKFSDAAKAFFLNVVNDYKSHGVEATIMACTEIPILLKDTKPDMLMIDSTLEHCRDAVEKALRK